MEEELGANPFSIPPEDEIYKMRERERMLKAQVCNAMRFSTVFLGGVCGMVTRCSGGRVVKGPSILCPFSVPDPLVPLPRPCDTVTTFVIVASTCIAQTWPVLRARAT